MKRNDWQFEYTAHVLADAAAAKKAHHTQRATWWEAKREEILVEVKANGLEVTESLAMQYSSLAATHGAQLVIKPEYKKQLSECHDKIKDHSDKIKDHSAKATQYDAWIQLLAANPEKRVGMDIDDFLFFFGK